MVVGDPDKTWDRVSQGDRMDITDSKKGPWPEFTSELRRIVKQHVRSTHEPESLKGYDRRKPSKDLEFEEVHRFDLPRRRERTFCAICQEDQKFWWGSIFWWSDGYLRPVGHCCAGRVLGHGKVRRARRDYIERERHDRATTRLGLVQESLPSLIDDLQELMQDRAFERREEIRQQFNLVMQPLDRHLGAAIVHNDGWLIVERRQRQYGVEETHRGSSGEASSERFAFVRDPVGRLNGAAAIDHRLDPRQLVRGALQALKDTRGAIEATEFEMVKASRLEGLLKRIGNALERVDRALDTLAAVSVFFGRENLVTVCRWANDPDNGWIVGTHTPVRAGLKWTVDDDFETRVVLPSVYRAPQLPALQSMQNVLNRDIDDLAA